MQQKKQNKEGIYQVIFHVFTKKSHIHKADIYQHHSVKMFLGLGFIEPDFEQKTLNFKAQLWNQGCLKVLHNKNKTKLF